MALLDTEQPAYNALIWRTPFSELPDELQLRVLYFLDIPELLSTSRTCRQLRVLSFDPLLHRVRLRYSQARVDYLLQQRPALYTLQPPISTIYLSRTHVAARRLHWSLVCIRLNRSLLRRPKVSTLISANILPKECCRYDRRSGQVIWAAGTFIERRRKVEKEHLRNGLRVWLDRKAHQIRARQKDAAEGVGVLVWRFSRKMKLGGSERDHLTENPKKDKVLGLRKFWESMGSSAAARAAS